MLAIGACAPSPWPESSVGTLKHQYAFRQYGEYSCLLRRDVSGRSRDVRTTLITCLLFHCFEPHHGYLEKVDNQVYSGLKLFRELTSSFYRPVDSEKFKSEAENKDPQAVQDDFLRALESFEIQAITFADSWTRGAHEQYRYLGQTSVDEMPEIFTCLDDASEMLEQVMRRSMYWLRSTMHLQSFSTNPSPSSSTISDPHDDKPGLLFFDVDPTFEERLETLKEYARWDDSFRPLLIHSRKGSAPHEDFLAASTLRLHWLAGYMSVASNNCYSSLVNNRKFPTELAELVDIARILLENSEKEFPVNESAKYVFDVQIIIPLMAVGWIYRHRSLRREAIQLLLRSPRKEGLWDGVVLGKIMAWLSGVEEEMLEAGDGADDCIPEWAAARCIKMHFDTAKREASVSCVQLVKGSLTGEERKRELVVPW